MTQGNQPTTAEPIATGAAMTDSMPVAFQETRDEGDATADSKSQLILAGERLFADRGVEGTSLREIAAAAGHGNNNAVRYHFGSKDGLIQAIFRYRVAQLEPIRQKLVDSIMAQGLSGDVRALWEVIVLPHLSLRTPDGRFPYAAFLLQYLLHYRPRGMTHVADDAGANAPNLHRAMALLRDRVFYLSEETADRRIMTSTALFLSVLINTENRKPAPSPQEFRAIIDDTLGQIVAAMAAPAIRATPFLDDSLFP